MSVYVSQLYTYPVKSLTGISSDKISIDEFGPIWDRRIMVVDQNGKFLTQRQLIQMSQVATKFEDETLMLSFKEQNITIQLSELPMLDKEIAVSVWNDEVLAVELPASINSWMSDVLEKQVKLCFIKQDTHRQVDLNFAKKGDRTGFSDGFPFLILSEASLEFLSDDIGYPLAAERFRPNIVVAGCDAFEEDTWSSIEINGILFDIVKPCSRCVIPTINPKTAIKEPQVMQVLLKHRKLDKQVYLGQNAIHQSFGSIEVGQIVKILK
ncbi:MOSC domain-containing protein [Oceaniserpentilla sp. 4NH20-0058]|uniref:MOSC domain-containing protein n=1 Tax=Oceaniserpentilla sp. 4NH20-0058 TaxID=3127660 RepID=UPI003106A969